MAGRKTAFALCGLLAWCAASGFVGAKAQSPSPTPGPPVAWEHQFPQNIEWYVRTSAGILLVRSAESLTAIDGVDGAQLWTLSNLVLPSGSALDVMEIPDFSILLINRARLLPGDTQYLLGVDLWTGQIVWQRPALDEIWQVVPLADSDRVLLLTIKDRKNFVTLPGPQVNRSLLPEMVLLYPRTGQADWTSEYPTGVLPVYLEVREAADQLYFCEYTPWGGVNLGRLDPAGGHRLWEFEEPINNDEGFTPVKEFSSQEMSREVDAPPLTQFVPMARVEGFVDADVPPFLQFVGDRVVFTGIRLFALDPASNKPAWTAPDLGKIYGIVADQDVILGSGDEGAFAIGAHDGKIRWRFKSKGRATNPLWDAQDGALLFCDDENFTELEAATGKVLRETPHHLGSAPLFIRRVGSKFIVAVGKKDAVLLNIATGEASEVFPRPDLELQSATFLVSWKNPAGFPDPPADLEWQLAARWPQIAMETGPSQGILTWHARMKLFLNSDALPLYANKTGDAAWELRRVDPATGAMQTFDATGERPDANPALGLVYLVEGDNRLRAVRIPVN
jgi:outer membrane protein assembly factor BamB